MRQPSGQSSAIANPRPDIITDEFITLLKKSGVVEAFLFGSFLRHEETPESDIDILVRFGHDYSLVDQLDLIVKLGRLTGREVDVLVDIHPVFEPYIRPTLVPIPL
jgi:predicted nucleotidyltransferase